MTEYWKSNAMHWCDLCQCWMNDTKAAKLNHERGARHQDNLAKKLREMAKKADTERKQEKETSAAMEAINKAAKEKFEADKKAAEAAAGTWAWDKGAGYYYNDVHRWYYDPKTQYYYGGNPIAWTLSPKMPSAAMFGTAPHKGGPLPAAGSQAGSSSSSRPAAAAAAAGRGASGSASTSGRDNSEAVAAGVLKVQKKVVAVPAHPLAQIGGHQMPVAGKIGGAKGVGSAGDPNKRKREEGAAAGTGHGKKKAVDPEEAEFLAKREAARQRVQQRTMNTFGLT